MGTDVLIRRQIVLGKVTEHSKREVHHEVGSSEIVADKIRSSSEFTVEERIAGALPSGLTCWSEAGASISGPRWYFSSLYGNPNSSISQMMRSERDWLR